MNCSTCAFAVSFCYVLLTPRVYLGILYVFLAGKINMCDAFQMRCLYLRIQNKKYPVQTFLIEVHGAGGLYTSQIWVKDCSCDQVSDFCLVAPWKGRFPRWACPPLWSSTADCSRPRSPNCCQSPGWKTSFFGEQNCFSVGRTGCVQGLKYTQFKCTGTVSMVLWM